MRVFSKTMPVEKDGVIFGTTKNGLIFALNAFTREVLWIHKTENSLINTLLPISATDCVFTSTEGM
jgi:FOG: WD40-like repeat